MTEHLVDRFHFLAKPGNRSAAEKTPIRNDVPQSTSTAEDAGIAVLRLYDPIDSWGGPWGVSAKEFAAALDSLDGGVNEIRLHINSPGGEIWEALAILNQLRRHTARVVTVVDGIAASAASWIAMAGEELVMAPNSELMIHDALGICVGNAADMTTMAADLARESDNIAAIYAAKAGGDVTDWRAAMVAETWYSAQEAVDAGLADRVEGADGTASNALKGRYNLAVFNYAGRAKAPTPTTPAAPSGPTPTKERRPAVAFSDEQLTTLRNTLGLPADADETTIVNAVNEALEERADPPATTTTAQLPPGTVAIDSAQLDALRDDAAAGRKAREQQMKDHRAGLVKAALRDGRISKAREQDWLNALEKDPGAEADLASLAPGLVPVDELGHADDEPNEDVRNSPAYKNWRI